MFLHSVAEGPASESYGLEVARLAGVPGSVIAAARVRLRQLERDHLGRHDQPDLFLDAAGPAPSPALEMLATLDPDSMSPREALDALFALKALD